MGNSELRIRRKGAWGVVERKPWATLVLCYGIGIPLRLVSSATGVWALAMAADIVFFVGVALLITGYVLRRRTATHQEALRIRDTPTREE